MFLFPCLFHVETRGTEEADATFTGGEDEIIG